MNWYVIYTKSRYEKAVADKLALSRIEVYCPLLKRKKLWSDRWKWVEEPLFRSYCFVSLDDQDRDRVFSVPGVVRYVYHCGKPAVIRDKEMDLLKSWLMQYDHDSIVAENLNVSDRIRIRSGALMDKEAEVLESKGNYALLLLEDLGLQVKVDLRKNIVEKIRVS
ncbi:MAG: UpxY family transcription antiterminator [Daejeonella sp.]|uniref:transcription termination/antitermination protein NusG n=1 Tax=Daejeonella sp. TaxID=2805397 RepID=UPI002732E114|nr:UpxY family transcription antiterminator [Daejeonella sp.]MDP3467545.1 UpxY family transcription antiterminator [Daejeonella sp.]